MATEDDLSKEFQLWCKNNNLPRESAEELILRPELNYEQRIYIADFMRRWEKANG